jgi:para-aminobenzoate synthetase component 1
MAITAQPTVLTRGIDLDLSPEQVFTHLHRVSGFFFLDSGMAEHELSRYSYFGVNPFLTLRSRGEGIDVVEGKTIDHRQGNPLEVLSATLRRLRITGGSPLVPFAAGGVGYLSYELGRATAGVQLKAQDDLGLPEMAVSFYKTILAYEHRTRRWFGASVDLTGGRGTTIRKRLGNEIDKLRELATKPHRGVLAPVATTPAETEGEEDVHPATTLLGERMTVEGVDVVSTLGKNAYLDAVRRIKEHIAAGDIYQANLTQRWSLPYDGDPGELYAALRRVSPAPYGIYLNTGECVVAGSSPECFLSISGRTVETRPIKGTRRRGATPEEDDALKRELEASAKDRAELVMITDLERNDLGRVCVPGTVRVEELTRLESYASVHHLVSVVKGELEPGAEIKDVLDATFPGGSITGAPKKRAMEILDGVEGTVRGPYTGAMGYFGYDGSLSLNVAIRTLVLSQGICHLSVGSGIVADSDPEAEYEECVAKAKGMLTALKTAPSETPVAAS